MDEGGAVCMAIMIILGILCVGAFLVFAGSVEIERRAERWNRYERWMHPPDDDDGISVVDTSSTAGTSSTASGPPSPKGEG